MNQNAFRHDFTGFIGYAMPIFVDFGTLGKNIRPFWDNMRALSQ
jgi:hypothetical protein